MLVCGGGLPGLDGRSGFAPPLLRDIRWGVHRAWSPPVVDLAQDALLVRLRAQATREAVPVGTGAMAAILEASKVAGGR